MELGTGAHVRCHGKGRKERITTLTSQAVALCGSGWPSVEDRLLTRCSRGGSGALSRDAAELLVARHTRTAEQHCPSLATKTVSPHVLRHSCAMQLLAAEVDTSVIALWLGHEGVETAQIYLHADLAIKERTLDNRPRRHGARSLSTARCPARVPGEPVIMPTS